MNPAVRNVIISAPFDADARAYFAAGEAAGSSMSASNKAAVNAFIRGCKLDPSPLAGTSNWDAMKALVLPWAWDTFAGALVPLKGAAPTNVNFVSGDYSRTMGLKGDGLTKYLAVNRANNADPQNNNSNWVYIIQAATNTGTYAAISIIPVVTGANQLGYNAGSLVLRSRSATISNPAATGHPVGFFGISRSSSSSFLYAYSGTISSMTRTSEVPGSDALNVFQRGNAERGDMQISAYGAGEAVDMAALTIRLNTLKAALQ